MNAFASFVIRRRLLVLIAVAGLSIWFGYHAATIPMDTDVLNFLPVDDPDVRFFRATGEKFGTNHINMVAIETEDIFTHDSLSALRALTRAMVGVDGVNQVMSLTNLLDMQPDGEGSISVRQLIDPEEVPSDPGELARIRAAVLANNMLVGNLVSADGRAALISVMIDEGADKEKVARDVKAAAAEALPGEMIYFGGFAMVMEYMSGLIAGDMGRLIPITIIVVLLILYFGLGSPRGVLLPMGAVILATAWTLGTMRFFGMSLNMLTSVIPVVIIAIGTASGIYLIVRYYEQGGGEEGGRGASERALAEELRPIAFSGLTMIIGFLSLVSAPLTVFKEFGIAAAIGSFWAMVLSLTFIPAALATMSFKAPRPSAVASPESARASRTLAWTARFVTGHRRWAITLTAVLVIVSALMLPGIPRYADLMSYFPDGSEPQVSELLLQRYFGGSQLFIVNFHADDVREPAILEQMELLEKRLRLIPDVSLPQSVAGVLKMLNRNLNGEPGLPDAMDKINNLWFMLEGQPSVEILLEKTFENGVVQARIGDINPAVVARAIGRVRETLAGTMMPDLAVVELAAQPEAHQGAFAKALALRIAEKVSLDVAYHGGGEVDRDALAGALVPIILEPTILGEPDRAGLAARLREYFGSDAADVVVESREAIDRIATRIAGLEDFSEPILTAVMKETLPPEAWQDDPESLEYAAPSILEIVDGRRRALRHEKAMAATLSAIDAGENMDGAFLEDLSSDLWGVNNAFVAVDTGTFTRITGEAPVEEMRATFETRLTGWPPVSAKFDAQLVSTIARAILLSMVAILVILILLLRSLAGGLVAAAPMIFTVLMNFGAMGLLDVPLDNTTLMISSIAMGVGVMYAIHFVDRFRKERAGGKDARRAVVDTMTTKGRAIVINTLTVALGFAVLVFSVMAPQRVFGLFIALTMILGNVGTFTVLPALLAKRGE